MTHWTHRHSIAVVACIAALFVLYMLASTENPLATPGTQHPPILWGYDPSETNCNDSVDNDNDGDVDCEDTNDCGRSSYCAEDCTNGIDDDGDEAVDCDDLWCQENEPGTCS